MNQVDFTEAEAQRKDEEAEDARKAAVKAAAKTMELDPSEKPPQDRKGL